MTTEIWHIDVPVGTNGNGGTRWEFHAEGTMAEMDVLSDEMIKSVTGGLAKDLLSDGKSEIYFAAPMWTDPILALVSHPASNGCRCNN